MSHKFGPPIQCSIVLKEAPAERLLFESFPAAIDESYSASFTRKPNRTSQEIYALYSGGKYGALSLTLTFVAGLHPVVNRQVGGTTLDGITPKQTAEILEKIDVDSELTLMEAKIRWLQALSFPRPKKPRAANVDKRFVLAGEPPRVLITYGRFMTVEGVVTSTQIRWKPPFHAESARPAVADITLSVSRFGSFYPDWYDIAKRPTKRVPTRLQQKKSNYITMQTHKGPVQIWIMPDVYKQ